MSCVPKLNGKYWRLKMLLKITQKIWMWNINKRNIPQIFTFRTIEHSQTKLKKSNEHCWTNLDIFTCTKVNNILKQIWLNCSVFAWIIDLILEISSLISRGMGTALRSLLPYFFLHATALLIFPSTPLFCLCGQTVLGVSTCLGLLRNCLGFSAIAISHSAKSSASAHLC